MIDAILIGVACVVVGAVALRLHHYRTDVARRRRAREDWEEEEGRRRAAAAAARMCRTVSQAYPYLTAVLEDVEASLSLKDALRSALKRTPGAEIGTTGDALPAVIPTAIRSRHLVIYGRSGAGKTVACLHILEHDFRRGIPVVVLCVEAELFPWLLGMAERRREEVIYFSIDGTVAYNAFRNPGASRSDLASFLLTALKSAFGEASIGPRSDPILANAIHLALTDPECTIETVWRVLADEAFRNQLLAQVADERVARFWRVKLPDAALLPLLARLDGFLRVDRVRELLCHPGSFTMQEVIDGNKLLFVDLSGFSAETAVLLAGLFIAGLQYEIMKRERGIGGSKPLSLVIDEFPAICGGDHSTALAALLSRSRKFQAELTLTAQFPGMLPAATRKLVAGNVSTLACFSLSARDAAATARELLVRAADGSLRPLQPAEIVAIPTGFAYLRVSNAATALKVKIKPPLPRPPADTVEQVKRHSWAKYGVVAVSQATTSLPLAVPASLVAAASTRTPGRGGNRHKLLQGWVRDLAEAHGFRSAIEEPVLAGKARVDVALVRGATKMAVEIALTSTPEEIAAAVTHYSAAGFATTVVLSSDAGFLAKARDRVPGLLDAKDRERVVFVDSAGFEGFLRGLGGGPERAGLIRGYRLRVTHSAGEAASLLVRRHRMARLVATALRTQDVAGVPPSAAPSADVHRQLMEAFLASGGRMKHVAATLNAQGLRTSRNAPWSDTAVRRQLARAVRNPELPQDLRTRCLALLEERDRTGGPTRRPVHFLGTSTHCAVCAGRMYFLRAREPKFHCKACGRKVGAAVLEGAFRSSLSYLEFAAEEIEQAAAEAGAGPGLTRAGAGTVTIADVWSLLSEVEQHTAVEVALSRVVVAEEEVHVEFALGPGPVPENSTFSPPPLRSSLDSTSAGEKATGKGNSAAPPLVRKKRTGPPPLPVRAYRVKQVAQILNLPESSAYDLVRRKVLPIVRTTRRRGVLLVPADAVESFLKKKND